MCSAVFDVEKVPPTENDSLAIKFSVVTEKLGSITLSKLFCEKSNAGCPEIAWVLFEQIKYFLCFRKVGEESSCLQISQAFFWDPV